MTWTEIPIPARKTEYLLKMLLLKETPPGQRLVHAERKKDFVAEGDVVCIRYEMTAEDHEKLADALHAVSGMVVLSGYDSDLYRRIYKDWATVSKDVHADGSAKRTEILWISPSAQQNMMQKSLMEAMG